MSKATKKTTTRTPEIENQEAANSKAYLRLEDDINALHAQAFMLGAVFGAMLEESTPEGLSLNTRQLSVLYEGISRVDELAFKLRSAYIEEEQAVRT